MTHLALYLAIGCAGALGALARFGFAEWLSHRWRKRFPLATFLINVSGALALGLLLTAGVSRTGAVPATRVILGAGFLGGYTTFSTLSFETNALARRGHTLEAWVNALGTLVVGVVAVGLGVWIGRSL